MLTCSAEMTVDVEAGEFYYRIQVLAKVNLEKKE